MESIYLQWSFSQKIAFRFVFCFVLLFLLTLPFPHTFLPNVGSYLQPLCERVIKWFGDEVVQIQKPYTFQLISDSTGMYLHLVLLLCLAFVLSLLWSIVDRKRRDYKRVLYVFRGIVSYYLAFQLLKYGFNKIFKYQFYLPEPNILFTNMGDVSRDLLYWSVMGASHSYSVFTGILEVIPAILLFFRRTRLLGALIAVGVLANVVMINISFDISVKLFSSFLGLLAVLIVVPEMPRLYYFFFAQKHPNKQAVFWTPVFRHSKQVVLYAVGKSLIVYLILFDVLLPYFQMNNFNDDMANRPFLHGAYAIEHFQINQDTIPPMLTNDRRWKRFFIHRQGYFIIENMEEQMQDFPLEVRQVERQLVLEDSEESRLMFEYNHSSNDELLRLEGIFGRDTLRLEARQINWRELPLLDKKTNWTIDAYFR